MEDIVITLLQQTFVLILELSVPILIAGMVLGLMVSVFQTVTQIQESTLTFVPKIIGGVIVLVVLLPWMFNLFISTYNEFIDTIPRLIGAM